MNCTKLFFNDHLKQDSIRKEQANADSIAREKMPAIIREEPKIEGEKQVEKKEVDVVGIKKDNTVTVNTPKTKTDDELYAEAKTLSDYKKLADKGYKKAYAPLSELYLKNKQYSLADAYAQKACISGVLVSRATKVMEILQLYGYYDDKTLPKVLEH